MAKRKRVGNENALDSKKHKLDANTWFEAALAGDNDLIQSLLAQGADVDHADQGGRTALMSALIGFEFCV